MGFLTLETAQAQLSPGGNFGPWIWDLKLRVEQISPEELRIRLQNRPVRDPGDDSADDQIPACCSTARCIGIARAVKVGGSTAFGEVEMFADGSPDPIAQSLSTFVVLPDGAGAFNRADSHAG
jgi:hypothetical protein